MKTHLLAFAILAVLCTTACSQPPAENDLCERLLKGPESVKALETVLKKPDEHSGFVLYHAALAAFQKKRLEDAGFLFYAAQLRARFDRECFPPKGEGGNSPFLVYAAFSEEIGSAINLAVMAEPKALEGALARLKTWTPKAPKGYHPGYEFTERKTEKDAHQAVQPKRDEFLEGMSGISMLLKDPEYLAAFKTLQAYNLGPRDKRPTKEANDKATETMKRIEKDKQIKGFLSK